MDCLHCLEGSFLLSFVLEQCALYEIISLLKGQSYKMSISAKVFIAESNYSNSSYLLFRLLYKLSTMCSGDITRHRCCGHEEYTYYYVCPDGVNPHYQKMLPHRLVGRRFHTNRLCPGCQDLQQMELENAGVHQERAKCLLEYFRGERLGPKSDEEVALDFQVAFERGKRLHPWLNRSAEPALDSNRQTIVNHFSSGLGPDSTNAEGARLFQEMLDRQADIDRTGRAIMYEDIRFILSHLLEQAEFYAAQVRYHDDLINKREQEIGQLQEEILERDWRKKQGMDELMEQGIDQLLRQGIVILNNQIKEIKEIKERAQSLQWFRDQIIQRAETDLHSFCVIDNAREAEHWNIRWWEKEREQIMSRIKEMERQELVRRLLMFRISNIEDRKQKALPAGLYESDPEWLLSFNDWCAENSHLGKEPNSLEIGLRHDINGWFQHLRSCESQARRHWVALAETVVDAILAGDRCRYDYIPLTEDRRSRDPGCMSFRQWCIANANRRLIRVSPMKSIFIELLEGYRKYLLANHRFEDLSEFLTLRANRVNVLRMFLQEIPGVPLTKREFRNSAINLQSPDVLLMVEDICHLVHMEHDATEDQVQERKIYMMQLTDLPDYGAARDDSLAVFVRRERRREQQRQQC